MKKILSILILSIVLLSSTASASSYYREYVHSKIDQLDENTSLLGKQDYRRFQFNMVNEFKVLPNDMRNEVLDLRAGHSFNMLEAGSSAEHMIYVKGIWDLYALFGKSSE